VRPIAVIFHCLVYREGNPPQLLPNAVGICQEFARFMRESGLYDAASEFIVGVNGGEESVPMVKATMGDKAKLVLHGLQSYSENLTIVELEKFVASHSGWNVLYAHSKGASHGFGDYANFVSRWRNCMLRHCVTGWRQCVSDLENGFEAVGCHWLTCQGWDYSQHYFAGNVYWSTSDFLATIPSIYTRERIKTSGIASKESRYEAEIVVGNGPRLPIVKDYANHTVHACP
jgi:hypothetical protein